MPKSAFTKNVLTLITGTGLAQAVPILISPILTRLYSPEDFGVFALFMAVAAIGSVIVTGRYELAIMLPKEHSEAINIVALAIVLSFLTSSMMLLVIYFFSNEISYAFGLSSVASWLYLVPVATALSGLYQALYYWVNRKKEYRRMATSRVVQSGGISTAQMAAGFGGVGMLGLIGGQILGQVLSTLFLSKLIFCADQSELKKINMREIGSQAKKHNSFPKYLILGQLANVASAQMPLLLLATFFGPGIAGFYALSQRTVRAPMQLIASAIGDVFRQEAATCYNRLGNCKAIFLNTLIKLAIFALLSVLPIMFGGPWLFAIVFGEEWREAGEIASIMSVMIFFQTISSPLSHTVFLAGMQAVDLIWQILRFFLSIASFYIGYVWFDDYKVAIIMHVASFSVLYVIHSLLQYKAAIGNEKGGLREG